MANAEMKVGGRAVPIGTIALHFQYFPDDEPPHALLDIHSDSDGAALGGLALNGVNIGDVSTPGKLGGRRYSFPEADETGATELAESVFWLPGDETLEIVSATLLFGELRGGSLPLQVHAVCFDHHGRQDIEVRIAGVATTQTEI